MWKGLYKLYLEIWVPHNFKFSPSSTGPRLKIHRRFGPAIGHLWRTGPDISDTWQSLLWNIDINDEVIENMSSNDQVFRCFLKGTCLADKLDHLVTCYRVINQKLFRTVFKGSLCKAQPAVGTIQTPSSSARWREKISFEPTFDLNLDYPPTLQGEQERFVCAPCFQLWAAINDFWNVR